VGISLLLELLLAKKKGIPSMELVAISLFTFLTANSPSTKLD
jgi:hypothetical protein